MNVYPVDKFDWQKLVRETEGIPQVTKLVAFTISTYASRDGANCHPGIERLAREVGLGERQLRRHLLVLREVLGLLDRTAHGGGRGLRLADVYQLVVPDDLPGRVAGYDKRRTSRCPQNRAETQDSQVSGESPETQDITANTPDTSEETPDIGGPYAGHPDVHPPVTYTSHIDQGPLSSCGDSTATTASPSPNDKDEIYESARSALASLKPDVMTALFEKAKSEGATETRDIVCRAAELSLTRTAVAS